MAKYYLTTPIYYPNDIPHIGHAYTTLVADVLARWKKLKGDDVFFLTGTDDHGKKIAKAAEEKGMSPQEFTDKLIPEFKKAWEKLNIKYDRFIRTTDKDHEKVVKEVLQKMYDKGDIYKSAYEGYYCVGCEAYYTEKDLEEGCCPIHKKKVEIMKEESYFFKLSEYQDKLLKLYEENPSFISPEHRKQEIVNRVKEGLKDLSISRNSFRWGVELPFDKEHITYVWIDALFNYYSATRKKGKEKYWPADVNIIGKDILWFHTVYWPAFLMSAGLKIPNIVFAHGWWTLDKEKVSKSRGKVINVEELIGIAGVDSIRYFLLREIPFGDDGDFSEEAVIERNNNELANELGNLVNRCLGMVDKYFKGKYKKGKSDKELFSKLNLDAITKNMDSFKFNVALGEIWKFIAEVNKYINDKKPWEDEKGREDTLYNVLDAIRVISILVSSFMPETSEKINKQLGVKTGSLKEVKMGILKDGKIKKDEILFKKIENA